MDWARRLVLVALCLLSPFAAHAADAQPAWDAAGIAGLFAGHVADGGSPGDDWFHAAQGGVIVGRLLGRHLKVEVEATATSRGTRLLARQVDVPGFPYPYWITSEWTSSVRSVATGASWQFGWNDWVHPFLQAGVSADFEAQTVRTPAQYFYGGARPPDPPLLIAEATQTESSDGVARAFAGGGAKLYVRERGFIRVDGRVAFGGHRQHLMFRVGAGLDF